MMLCTGVVQMTLMTRSQGCGSIMPEKSAAVMPCKTGKSAAAAKAQPSPAAGAKQAALEMGIAKASEDKAAAQGRPMTSRHIKPGSSTAPHGGGSNGACNTSSIQAQPPILCLAAASCVPGDGTGAAPQHMRQARLTMQEPPSSFGFAQGLQVLQGATAKTAPAAATRSAPATGAACVNVMRAAHAPHAPHAPPEQAPSGSRARRWRSRGSGDLVGQQGASMLPVASSVASLDVSQQLWQGSQDKTSSMANPLQQHGQHTPQPQQQRSSRCSPGKENSAPGAHASVGSNLLSAHSEHMGCISGQAWQAAGNPAMLQCPRQQQGDGDVLGGLLQTLKQLAQLSQLQWLAEAQRMAQAPSQPLPPMNQQLMMQQHVPLPLHANLRAATQVSCAAHCFLCSTVSVGCV